MTSASTSANPLGACKDQRASRGGEHPLLCSGAARATLRAAGQVVALTTLVDEDGDAAEAALGPGQAAAPDGFVQDYRVVLAPGSLA